MLDKIKNHQLSISKMKINRIIKNNVITCSIVLMLVLIVSNAGFIVYNNHVLAKTTETQSQVTEIKALNQFLWNDIVRNLDVGVRGYAVSGDENMLKPYQEALNHRNKTFGALQRLLESQQYDDIQGVAAIRTGVDTYAEGCTFLIELIRKGDMDTFKAELKKDKGFALWQVYKKFTDRLYAYEDALHQQAEQEYQAATNRTIIVQILLVLIGLPALIFVLHRIRKDTKEKQSLFVELDNNNRQYLFDSGIPTAKINERELINHSIVNFKKAAGFINQISKGNYQVDWEGLDHSNQSLNQTNLAGELIQMREKMKHFKSEDEKRLWATEGIAQLSEVIRSQQHNLKGLSDHIVAFVVKYLKAQQGGLFLLMEESDEKYLSLLGCYAFDRKKYIEKRIEIGQGLVGQTYLEKETNLLTEIPQGYTAITSGLGDATPTCLLVVPMKYNDKVEAVIELASFNVFEPHQIEWLEKVGEVVASTLISVKTAERTQKLLEQFRMQTEQLKAQEEELRQNMEEMEATQEEMRRKEQELERRQRESQIND